jgi:hypothetical protein
LPDIVTGPAADAPLDRPLGNGYCAEISVQWIAETPILIGGRQAKDGPVEPMRLGETWVIPGATLRGLVRSSLEIVAHGKLGASNLHHRYGLRDFDHPFYSEESPISRVDQVHSGWLTITPKKDADPTWTILPCKWGHLPIDSLIGKGGLVSGVDDATKWSGTKLEDKYQALGMRRHDTYDFSVTSGFIRAPDDHDRQVFKPAASGGERGVVVVSNRLPGKGRKRFEYVFFDDPARRPFTVRPDQVDAFERLYCRPSKNKPVPDGSWKVLNKTAEASNRIPVFYVGNPEDRTNTSFFFGLTRLFKIPHKHSVRQVIAGHRRTRSST